ncbi:putative inner membrane protein [Yersinia enterocolitica]|uniref:Inner membrane protein n=1 Tax=Yersinia enterocolitica serotype O:8 / biotype 1B (strain NCTC 13174 / 8081) TaxID=393305 RepID=A1JLZ5_YERE8|nr:mechanosensitive ion channel family protein [Yersinia enterocolitica]AJI84858.1 mechanosensitive ion channel family protein [Yersinia enterocolitica]AJJ21661.1 mechanosensitive ion channel family protein [Yersinia enterocolitica]EKA27628.1 MscS family inner membrane protein YnaI [Yersinia enterocolitica subsp. enterocolitica WA-314]ELI8284138.1 mechanosensitive ion channel family protein [Yersinia enterocolitica]KGA71449.1 mechanosensitive ion channel family protein [Yersinia enterocolitica
MIAQFTMDNIVGLILVISCVIALLIVSVWGMRRHHSRYSFILQFVSFLLWSVMVMVMGNIINNALADIKISFITPKTVNFVCMSVILLMLIRKMFVLFDVLEKRQVAKGSDITSAKIIARMLKITLVVVVVLLYGEHLGMSFSGLVTFGGIGGLAVGLAGKDILSNFFSGVMLYFDRPFNIGDWIRLPDRHIEGVVVEIGWRLTKIMTFENRPLYVPNSAFTDTSVENPGRMTNRRIKTTLALRYEDADKIGAIVDEMHKFLANNDDIDHQQTLLVYFNGFGESSLNIMVYCFTKTRVWAEWLAVQQTCYLKFIDIVHQHGADFAFPSRTLYVEDSTESPFTPAEQ